MRYMASLFGNAHCILFIDYLEKERTINSEYYMVLLARLMEEIAKKRPQMKKKMSQVDKFLNYFISLKAVF